MKDYMIALHQRFCKEPECRKVRKQIRKVEQDPLQMLDRRGQRQLLNLAYMENELQDEVSLLLLRRRGRVAGLKHLRFHDLRNAFATMAFQNGVDLKTVSAMLGHYDAGFTLLTYTHTTHQKQDEAAQTMGTLIVQVR